jgi:hypothetical protein
MQRKLVSLADTAGFPHWTLLPARDQTVELDPRFMSRPTWIIVGNPFVTAASAAALSPSAACFLVWFSIFGRV